MNQNNLILNEDYYLDVHNNFVFTKEYHLKRGHCCQSGCLHCPYSDLDPFTPQELQSNWSELTEANQFSEELEDDED